MHTARNILFTVTVALFSAMAASAAVALLLNIHERKDEGKNPFFRVVDLDEETQDPATWGKDFPQQYDSYLKTVEEVRTRFGGSEAMPRVPSVDDPRTVVSESRLDEDPRLVTMWAGYAFSKDFREDRGHAYMLLDQEFTGRQKAAPQPGACIHCHASIVVPYRKAGDGDLFRGWELLNHLPYAEARTHVQFPIACIDCHDPSTMQLRVTRPGFIEGIRALKASQGIADYDPNRDATRQEMRSFVCGQCHVEYYMKGPEKRLTYPWAKGLEVDEIYAYYQEVGFKDWTHALTGAPTLKAQHPEFEMWNQGIHARAGVACADCHMPYERVGAYKLSDHQVRSPLLNINRACQTCHKASESELRGRAEEIQTRTFNARNEAMDSLVDLIGDLQAAVAAGKTDEELTGSQQLQRQAQFYLDFVEAENSVGFHAPQEAVRILGESMNLSRQGQVLLRDPSFVPSVRRATHVGPASGT
jgi:nitrite reductase (cytochrome c-552)